jgi:hypothetical protein
MTEESKDEYEIDVSGCWCDGKVLPDGYKAIVDFETYRMWNTWKQFSENCAD